MWQTQCNSSVSTKERHEICFMETKAPTTWTIQNTDLCKKDNTNECAHKKNSNCDLSNLFFSFLHFQLKLAIRTIHTFSRIEYMRYRFGRFMKFHKNCNENSYVLKQKLSLCNDRERLITIITDYDYLAKRTFQFLCFAALFAQFFSLFKLFVLIILH